MPTLAIQLALAVLLFYLINWIGRHSSGLGYMQLTLFVRPEEAPAFNFLLRVLSPSVFIIIVAVSLYTAHFDRFTAELWRVAAYYYVFRLLYNVTLGRGALINWLVFIIQATVGVSASLLAYRYLILPRDPLIPDVRTIGNELWIAIALFLYATLNNVKTSTVGSERRKKKYLASRMTALRKSYAPLVDGKFPKRILELVVYAILIHETFNRPRIVRWLERLVFPHLSRTLGVMQVETARPITDEESVRIGVAKLRESYELTVHELSTAAQSPPGVVLQRTIAKYNRDDPYVSSVFELIGTLALQVVPEYRVEYERLWIPE